MFHAQHIQRLMTIAKGVPVVLAGYQAMQLSGDMEAPFLQEATFWWLTGIEEPGWRMIIEPARAHVTLVRPDISPVQQIFNGSMTDEVAAALCLAQEVIASSEFEPRLRQLARIHTVVQTQKSDNDEPFVLNPAQRELTATLRRVFPSVVTISKEIAELRAVKSDAEITRIRHAVRETVAAFQTVRQRFDGYKYEYEIEADFTQLFRRRRGQHAYAPIVASGEHACTLHYGTNSGRVRAKDVVVIDIGGRFDGYAADITRTYGIKPTKRQLAVHAAVQDAQQRTIELLGPDMLVSDYVAAVDDIMKDALQSLGLLTDRSDTEKYRKYFPHAIGHGLGVDVHDSLGAPRYFQPGMVMTVEPGIYIPEEGIGVRIEDDILITATGCENLSRSLSTDL